MAYAIEASRAPGEPRWPALQASLAVFGLAVFAVSFPLVRLLVDAPEFFISHGMGSTATGVFFLAVIVGVPGVLALVGSLPGPFGVLVRRLTVGALAILAVAGVLQPISRASTLFVIASLGGGIALAVFEQRHLSVRSTLATLSVVALVLVGWVAGPSRLGDYVRSGEAELVEPVAEASEVSDAPVVFVVFDEMSQVHLLDEDLEINRERFPNFAALADTSHWFRNASSISPQTSASVPALLSGMKPDHTKVPVAPQYPANLFLQLGSTHEIRAYEPITALCPDAVCGQVPEDPADPDDDEEQALDEETVTERSGGSSIGDVLDDVLIVYRHAVGSDAMREGLPSISQGWGGFATPAGGGSAQLVDAGDDEHVHAGGYGTFTAQARELQDLIIDQGQTDRPQLRFAHLVAPHMPWLTVHDGSTYRHDDLPGLSAQGGTLTWGADEADRAAGYQRLLLQLGALDREIGALRFVLESQGRWDEALVVITADHGVQFNQGGSRAVGAGGVEVTGVPLFIKEPGQTAGVVDDRPALTMDIVPTILAAVGVSSPTDFDGLDLFGDELPTVREDGFFPNSPRGITPDQGLDGLRDVVSARSRWIDANAGWDAVYQLGVAEPLVGRAVGQPSAAAGDDLDWRRRSDESGPKLTVEIIGPRPGAGVLAASCAGTFAGAVDAARAAGGSTQIFLSPDRCPDPDAAELWLVDGAGTPHPTRRLP